MPRYLFLEPLIAERRVLELGAAEQTVGRSTQFLKTRGASLAVAIVRDDEALKALQVENEEGIEFRTEQMGLSSQEEFDLIIHHQPALDPESVKIWAGYKRLLSRSGQLVLVVRQPGGMSLMDLRGGSGAGESSFEELTAALQDSYKSLEVANQAVFFGYSIATQAGEELETALDESLTDQTPPAYRLLLCGRLPSGLSTVALAPLGSRYFRDLAERAPAAADQDLLGLNTELELDRKDQRVRELEAKTQSALDEAEKATLAYAQVIAERDHLRARLEAGSTSSAQPQAAPDEAAALNAELEQLRADTARLTEELASRQRAEQELRDELEGAKARAAQVEGGSATAAEELAALGRELAQREEQLSNAQEAARQREAEAQELAARVAALQVEVARHAEQLSAAEAAALKSDDEATGLRSRVTALEGDLSIARATAERQAKESADMATRSAELEAELAHQAQQLLSRSRDADERAAELERHAATSSRLAEELAARERELAVRGVELDTLRRELETVMSDHAARSASREADVARLAELLQEADRRVDQLEEDRRQAASRLETMAVERDELARKAEETGAHTARLQGSLEEAQARLHSADAARLAAEQQLDSERTELAGRLRAALDGHAAELAGAREATEGLRRELETRREEHQALAAERDGLAGRAREAEAALQVAKDHAAELERRLESSGAELERLREQHGAARADVEELSSGLSEARERVQAREQELREALGERDAAVERLHAAVGKAEALDAERDALNRKLSELAGRVGALDAAYKDAFARLTAAEDSRGLLEAKLKAAELERVAAARPPEPAEGGPHGGDVLPASSAAEAAPPEIRRGSGEEETPGL